MSNNRLLTRPSSLGIVYVRLGERLCLDFVNTVAHRLDVAPEDLLPNYRSLIDWALSMDVINTSQFDSLVQLESETPQITNLIFERALTMRETFYRLFTAIASQLSPKDADLACLHSLYTEAITHTRLALTGNNYGLTADSVSTPEFILWTVARSAVNVLIGDHMSRLKQCPGLNDCGYLFLDTSKNGTRQWCSMDFCGSRAKMRRMYARKRGRYEQNTAHEVPRS